MRTLFIDTSSFNVTVAILENDSIVAKFYDRVSDDMASKIFPIIDDLFSKLSFDIKDINKVYVVNGPGSFTGVRIGVTIAKVLASQLNIDIYPISSLEYMASGTSSNAIALIDARRDFVYAGAYDSDLNCLLEDKYTSLESIDLTKYNEIISFDNFAGAKLPNPNIIKLINKYNNMTINAHKVNPNYLKLTEAEENRH